MRLKTTTQTQTTKDASDACREQLFRGGFKDMNNSWWLRHGDKPGEVYDVWVPFDGFRIDYFAAFYKGTVAGSKNSGWTTKIILILA